MDIVASPAGPERPQRPESPAPVMPQPRPGAVFFYSNEENVAFLVRRLKDRQEPGSAFVTGLGEHVRHAGMTGGFSHGWWGRLAGQAAGLFAFFFTWPFYVWWYGRHTANLARRVERLQNTRPNTGVIVPLGVPRDSLSFVARCVVFCVWPRLRLIRGEIERHTGKPVGRGVRKAVRALMDHFAEESGTLVPDPDMGAFEVVTKLGDAMDMRGRDGLTMWRKYEKEVVERKERFRGPAPAKFKALQETLNRHWEFHMRQMPVLPLDALLEAQTPNDKRTP